MVVRLEGVCGISWVFGVNIGGRVFFVKDVCVGG